MAVGVAEGLERSEWNERSDGPRAVGERAFSEAKPSVKARERSDRSLL